jgi:hypothetical protein
MTNIKQELRELLLEIFIIDDDKYLEYTDAGVWITDKAIDRLIALHQRALVEELNKVWKTAVDNNVAGQVKWYLEDRIEQLKEQS